MAEAPSAASHRGFSSLSRYIRNSTDPARHEQEPTRLQKSARPALWTMRCRPAWGVAGGRRAPRPRPRHTSAIATPPRPARALASPHPEGRLRPTGWRRRSRSAPGSGWVRVLFDSHLRRRAGQPQGGPAQTVGPGFHSTATSAPPQRRRPRRRSQQRTWHPGARRAGRAGQPRLGCGPRPAYHPDAARELSSGMRGHGVRRRC